MQTLQLRPDRDGYSVTDGNEVVSVTLDGGASRTRRDILGAWSKVSVSWKLDPTEYEYLRTFYRVNAYEGFAPFQIELLLDKADVELHTAKFIPQSMTLTQQSGLTYFVSAQLEVEPMEINYTLEASLLAMKGYDLTLEKSVLILAGLNNVANFSLSNI